ncbi:DinB family protein [Streptomyces sp. ST2-7A]|uniref:DinB family protein n=1 Tax=Streptomyces sp. ST2-7A TaxID=2907214 RepID=UPI001F38289F|nr:DinB family protein [Streptomyces sp. ST2-7A]MCE7082066.1 DinB family protein [Streptomyces sp. ST2-7A]
MTPPGPVTRDVLRTLDEVRSRTLARLDGLTDAEYLWEPVAPCLTIRRDEEGVLRADRPSPDDSRPAPFTTIAWRMWHIGADCLRGYGRFFGDEPPAETRYTWPGTATGGIRALDGEWSRFRARVETLDDDGLPRPMGAQAGPYADSTYLLLVLHALDEAAHHGAELGVLRDLHLHGFAAGGAGGAGGGVGTPG